MNAPLLAWMGGLASLLAATGSLVVEDDVVAGPDRALPAAAQMQAYQSPALDLEKMILQVAYPTGDPLVGWEWRKTVPEGPATGDRLAGPHFSF